MNENRNAGENDKQLNRSRYLSSVKKLHNKVSIVVSRLILLVSLTTFNFWQHVVRLSCSVQQK